jgi:RNA polymerase sigma factor (TIGR02999 family)
VDDQNRPNVTLLLEAAAKGDRHASEQLLPVVYEDLRRLASALMARERSPGMHTLQPTALVHEAYLRLVGGADVSWENRGHFFSAAATAMRRILIDRARHIRATRLPITDGAPAESAADPGTATLPGDPDDLLALDAALDSLKARDDRQHDVVLLRYFAGLTIDQTAGALGVSPATVKNDWTFARAWLLREMRRQREQGPRP